MRSYSTYRSELKRRRKNGDRGAAILEFAIVLPVFIGLLLLVFDAGLGYSASRTSSSAARTAARIGALAGETANADIQTLEALRSQWGTPGEEVGSIVIYKSDASNTSGLPTDPACYTESVEDVCNYYDASILSDLTEANFLKIKDANGVPIACGVASKDAAWCPLDRREDGQNVFLGVYIESDYDTTTGIDADAFTLKDRAVFAIYFAPEADDAATP